MSSSRLVALLVPVIDDVVEMLETGGNLVAAGVVEFDELGLDVLALLGVEVSPLERGHAVVSEVLEARAAHVVVCVVVPGGRGLDVRPGHDRVVHHGHPALRLQQALGTVRKRALEGEQVARHAVVRHGVSLRLKAGRGHRFIYIFLEILEVGLQLSEIWRGHDLPELLPELWPLQHHAGEQLHQLRVAQALHGDLGVHTAHALSVQLHLLG